MSDATAAAEAIKVRPATDADNRTLVDLAALCPMEGDMSLCVRRAPEFFALNRLEGDEWRVGVVEGAGGAPIACVGVAFQSRFVNGKAVDAAYAGDLKVHPDHRTQGMARVLAGWVGESMHDQLDDIVAVATTLGGNEAAYHLMEAINTYDDVRYEVAPITTIRTSSVLLLWRRRKPDTGLTVTRATEDDVEAMVELWQEVAPTRHFAPVYDVDSFTWWVKRAPGLDLADFLLARRPNGRLAGFFGLWDQHEFKQMHAVGYSRGFNIARHAFNLASPLVRAPRMPKPGGEVRYRTVVNPCIPLDGADVLRTLLLQAYNDLRAGRDSFFTIGLDVRDPVAAALKGLMAQPADIDAWVLRAPGAAAERGPLLDDRPLHFEIAMA